MKRRLTFLIVVTFAIFVVGYGVRGSAQQPAAPASQPGTPQSAAAVPASPAAAHQGVVTKYCYTCHNDKLKSGGLALTALDISAPAKNSESWEKVIRKLGT